MRLRPEGREPLVDERIETPGTMGGDLDDVFPSSLIRDFLKTGNEEFFGLIPAYLLSSA